MNHALVVTIGIAFSCTSAVAQDYTIRSFTIDSGGVQGATAGSYSLSGTAGQPDAGAIAAGNLVVRGGFWTGSAANVCVADFNGDGNVNFFDVSTFVAAFNDQSSTADFAAPFGILNFFDIAAFIQVFSNGCP